MRIFCALVLLLALSMPAFAADENPAEVQAVENYLNSLTTLHARFVQTGNDGQQVAGNFYLKRPGRMRFQYDPPVKDFIVADGTFIYYYDSQMKQARNAPVSQSLADFFLRPHLKLAGDIKVSAVFRRDKLLQITLVQASDPLSGSMTLCFEESPMTLKKWRVVDSQGLVTEVALSGIETGMRLDRNLFHYYDPENKQIKYN